MARVFISHASEDRAVAGQLHQWLADDSHEVFIAQDLRDGVALGEEWERRIHEELRRSAAVVCVLTSAFLRSRWCAAEVAIARSRGSRLLPVQIEPRVTDPLLMSVQYVDMTRDPDAVRPFLISALRQLDTAWPDGRSPFPGLRPFEIDQHQVFFGRADELGQLAELMRSPAERAEGAVLLVVGPSGCGKSSLVRAGLLPVMAKERGWLTLPAVVPGAAPVAALVRELAGAARWAGLPWTVTQVGDQLDYGGLTRMVDELLLAAPGGPRRRLLLVVDQFEELLTQAGPVERARFVELLRPALTGPVHLVATLRPEFLDQLLASPELVSLPTRPYPLRPLGREALRAVIERPAQLAGIGIDDSLVSRLVEDTASGDALPLLAFTLAELADGVRRGGQLSGACYDQLGGVQGALTRQANAALGEAILASGRRRDQVITGLLRLVTVDEQGHPTRWRARRDELPAPVIIELDAFVARRLLTTDTDNGTVVIGVAHEAFLSAWPPLAQAIVTAASGLRARRSVEHAAIEWDHHGRPPTRLWGGGQLAAAVTDTGARLRPASAPPGIPRQRGPSRWVPTRRRVLVTERVDLSPTARDFLRAGIRRDRSRRHRAITVLSVLLILALASTGVAVAQQIRAQQGQRLAQEQERIATARQLAAQADATIATNPATALRLGLAAYHLHPSGETRTNLINALTSTRYVHALDGPGESIAFAPGRHILAAGGFASDPDGDYGEVLLWDVTDPTRPRQLGPPLTGHTSWVGNIAFAPDGHTLATASYDGQVLLWDVTDPTQPRQLGPPLTGHNEHIPSVAFTPDGLTLATTGYDGTVLLWDLTDPTQPRQLGPPLTGHTSVVNTVAFTPDGLTLATGSDSDGGQVLLWDLSDPAQPRQLGPPLTGHTGFVNTVAFTPDGLTLATGGYEVILWDLTDRNQPRRLSQLLPDETDLVRSVAFSPNGHTLATGGDDATVLLWDLTNPTQPQQLGQPLTGHGAILSSVAFSADGRTLASTDGQVFLWDLTDPTRPRQLGPPLTGPHDYAPEVALTPDGRTLATSGTDGQMLLWDLTDPAQPRQLGTILAVNNRSVGSVAFAPNGHILAVESYGDPGEFSDVTVSLWDTTNPAQPRQLGPPLTGQASPMAFTAEGHILATTSIEVVDDTVINNGTVALWDLTNPSQPQQIATTLSNLVTATPDGHALTTSDYDDVDGPITTLWDLTNSTQPQQLTTPLKGYSRFVESVAFAPDGRTVATVGDGGVVVLWDLTYPDQPGRLDTVLTGHPRYVSLVAFAPDGRTLVTDSADGSVLLWDLTDFNDLLNHPVERACVIAGGGLDRDQWTRFAPGQPYQDSCPV